MMRTRSKLKPGHVALCVLVIGLAIALGIAGSGAWLVPLLLIGCVATMAVMMWAMGGYGRHGG
jgi:hypothetical protein